MDLFAVQEKDLLPDFIWVLRRYSGAEIIHVIGTAVIYFLLAVSL